MPSYKLNPTVAIEVKNYEEALRFYREVLGMSAVGRSGEGKAGCLLCKEDVTLFVMDSPEGNSWLSLESEDIEGARKQLVESGCEVTAAPLGGYLVVDPFGTRFYLTPVDA